jgi:hypothetical protein
MPLLAARDLLDLPSRPDLAADGVLLDPIAVVDLTDLGDRPACDQLTQLAQSAADTDRILVGRCGAGQIDGLQQVLNALSVTVVDDAGDHSLPPTCVAFAEADAAIVRLIEAVQAAPRAALVLGELLRQPPVADVRQALATESAAYSMLLASQEFLRWRATRPVRTDPGPTEPAVILDRDDDVLTLTLNRPERHNAFGRWVRDMMCEGLDLAIVDSTIREVVLRGAGASFCSGGDLDEFGSQPDVATAHVIRLERNVGWRLHQLADRAVAELHGACIGAGVELPAFAGRVTAHPGTWFALPELSMGLIAGAGGTVSLPRRIGRWRTAWLALTGTRIDLDTALSWGLVDDVVD